MFILLQELMYRTFVEEEGRAPRRDEIPKPCDHFDLIVGTGTGGLIALMLGRMRMDLESCKETYVRTTRHVFETDKTIAGIPYRSTLFKASRLEEAIKQCVREQTADEPDANGTGVTNMYPNVRPPLRWKASRASLSSSQARLAQPAYGTYRSTMLNGLPWGNPDAPLYDPRENRCKTAVTAVYKGSKNGTPATLLRSYDSRKEPPPEFNCTIWQAGRATCATQLAFKPIQIGQHVFIDEGAGTYNPAPLALDEAVINEWPGREIGVFVSVGTGKRPPGSHRHHEWWEDFVGDALGSFAEARRRLLSKIDGCEEIHQKMISTYLPKRHVKVENYYRLNVDMGVGEFGMNEWNRLADISTNTRKYLSRPEVQDMTTEAAMKLARIHKMHRPHAEPSATVNTDSIVPDTQSPPPPPEPPKIVVPPPPPIPAPLPGIVELPADAESLAVPHSPPHRSRRGTDTSEEKIVVAGPGQNRKEERSSTAHRRPSSKIVLAGPNQLPAEENPPTAHRRSSSKIVVTDSEQHPTGETSPTHNRRPSSGDSRDDLPSQRHSQSRRRPSTTSLADKRQDDDVPPPPPPKSPIPYPVTENGGSKEQLSMPVPTPGQVGNGNAPRPPYPMEPPPVVNKLRKPTYNVR